MIKAWISQLQTPGIFPIDAAAHGVSGLAVRKPLHILQHHHQSQPGGRGGRLAARWKQGGKLFIKVEMAEDLDQTQTENAFRKGGMGYTPVFLGNDIGRLWLK